MASKAVVISASIAPLPTRWKWQARGFPISGGALSPSRPRRPGQAAGGRVRVGCQRKVGCLACRASSSGARQMSASSRYPGEQGDGPGEALAQGLLGEAPERSDPGTGGAAHHGARLRGDALQDRDVVQAADLHLDAGGQASPAQGSAGRRG